MKKVMFVFLLIFSLLIISAKEYKCDAKDKGFNDIEEYVLNQYEFVQNGIKLEYITDESLETEYERVDNLLKSKRELVVSNENNCIYACSDYINYSISVYEYKQLTKVEVIVLNTDDNIKQVDLELLAKEVRGSYFKDERVFSFIKGKVDVANDYGINELVNDLNIEFSETLNINNGYIAKATIGKNENINIGKVSYDTGSYLIIGTPIIFVTY